VQFILHITHNPNMHQFAQRNKSYKMNLISLVIIRNTRNNGHISTYLY